MSALNDLSKLASNANSWLVEMINDYDTARAKLIEAHENQSVAIRALAAVKSEHDVVRRGQELELRAIQALTNVEIERQS